MDHTNVVRQQEDGGHRSLVQRSEDAAGFIDGRQAALQLAGQQALADESARMAQLRKVAQLVERSQRPNKTGMPDALKAGIESLSGMSMDHVKVHYNSDKPAQLQAHAYAQGSEIHLAAGQERHLPHEAWHIVQQAQGRVRPILQMKGAGVNDDPSLEKEADMMGEKAAQFKRDHFAQDLVPEEPVVGAITQRISAFQRVTKNDAQRCVAGYQTIGCQAKETNACPVQLLAYSNLPEQEYGLGASRDALRFRLENPGVRSAQNVATFHFVPRPAPDDSYGSSESFVRTEASTGIGHYVEVSKKTEAQKRINTSHSEHQLINGELRNLKRAEEWPEKFIIDWIYTERPACPDVWFGGKFVAKGCNTELEEIERVQKLNKWDRDSMSGLAFDQRTDLNILVYSTFTASANTSIDNAAKFAPLRLDALRKLTTQLSGLLSYGMFDLAKASLPAWNNERDTASYSKKLKEVSAKVVNFTERRIEIRNKLIQQLTLIYQKRYEEGPSEDYDLIEYEGIPEVAFETANNALSWYDDYYDEVTIGEYERYLNEEAIQCLEEESNPMRSNASR